MSANLLGQWASVIQAQGEARSCYCIGPQNGDPVCPCRMRHVKIVNGRYVIEQDLGPAPQKGEPK